MSRLFLRKSVQDCENDILERGGLKRSLGKWHLTALGVGATIGAGIFATTGTAIVGDAAPSRRRPGHRPLLPAHRGRLRLRGALLRRVRRHGADLRLGLHLRLRLARRAGRLDHRLGPDRRVRGGQHRRGDRLVGILPRAAEPLRRLRCRPGSRPTIRIGARWRRRRWRPAPPTRRSQYLASALTTAPHLFGFPRHRQSPRLPDRRRSSPWCWSSASARSANSNNAMVILKIGIILFFCAVGAYAHPAGELDQPGHRRLRAQRLRRDQRRRGDHLLQLHRLRRDVARRPRRRRTRPATCRSGSS